MAQGRMIARKISTNKDLPRLIAELDASMGAPHGAMAALLYTWSIAHLDVEGRMNGDPHVVKGNVVPRVSFITAEFVERYLLAMANIGLVVYYEADGDRWLQFRGFDDSQPGLRKDREAASKIPTPESGIPVPGTPPAQLRSNAGVGPAEENRREENRKESIRARVDSKKLQQAWLEATGNIGTGALSDLAMRCEEHAPLIGVDPTDYAIRFCAKFAEWVASCPPGKRPSLSPLKALEHFERIHDMLAGKRQIEPQAVAVESKRPQPKPYEKKYADGEA